MAIGGPAVLFAILGIIAGALLVVLIFMYVFVPMLKGIGWIIGKFFWLIGAGVAHIFRFISGMFRDTFRGIGAVPPPTIARSLRSPPRETQKSSPSEPRRSPGTCRGTFLK